MCSESCYLHSLVCGPTLNNFWSFCFWKENILPCIALLTWWPLDFGPCHLAVHLKNTCSVMQAHLGDTTGWSRPLQESECHSKMSCTFVLAQGLAFKLFFKKNLFKRSKATCSKTRYVCISLAEVGLLLGKVGDKNSRVFKEFSLMPF